jgi:hypothetical protein
MGIGDYVFCEGLFFDSWNGHTIDGSIELLKFMQAQHVRLASVIEHVSAAATYLYTPKELKIWGDGLSTFASYAKPGDCIESNTASYDEVGNFGGT